MNNDSKYIDDIHFGRGRIKNPTLTAFFQAQEEKSMAQDLKHFLEALKEFMIDHSIPSLDGFEEKHSLQFLKFIWNKRPQYPVIDVDCKSLDNQNELDS